MTHWQWLYMNELLLNDAGATCKKQMTQTLTKWTSRSLRLTSTSATQVGRSWFWRVFACHTHRDSAKYKAWRWFSKHWRRNDDCGVQLCAVLWLWARAGGGHMVFWKTVICYTLSWDGERLFTETDVFELITYL